MGKELSERGRFEQLPLAAVRVDRQLGEDPPCFRRPGGIACSPEPREPCAQLLVRVGRVEDPPDDELRSDRTVPVVLLEPEGDVEVRLQAHPVELAAEAEGDRTSGVAPLLAHPKAQVLSVPDGCGADRLAVRNEKRHVGITEPEGCELLELAGELEGQRKSRHDRVDPRHRPQVLVAEHPRLRTRRTHGRKARADPG